MSIESIFGSRAIEPVKTTGASTRVDNKKFDIGKHNEYDEKLQLKMKCLVPFSKRWRVSAIRSSDGKQVYIEIDKHESPDTIFDVTASHAVLDPFGKVSYFSLLARRSFTVPRTPAATITFFAKYRSAFLLKIFVDIVLIFMVLNYR